MWTYRHAKDVQDVYISTGPNDLVCCSCRQGRHICTRKTVHARDIYRLGTAGVEDTDHNTSQLLLPPDVQQQQICFALKDVIPYRADKRRRGSACKQYESVLNNDTGRKKIVNSCFYGENSRGSCALLCYKYPSFAR